MARARDFNITGRRPPYEFHVDTAFDSLQTNLLVVKNHDEAGVYSDTPYVIDSVTWKKFEGGVGPESLFGMDSGFKGPYQELMNQLWQLGFRPSHLQHVEENTKRIQEHLADMRQIAFGKLNIEKP